MLQLLLSSLLVVVAVQVTITHAARCSFREGNYQLDWAVTPGDQFPNGGQIHFQLIYHHFPANMDVWTGVAFGDSMPTGLDATIVKSLGGRLGISDEFVSGYGPSRPDPQQNLQVEALQIVNGTLLARFSRPVWATEPAMDRDLRGCTMWQVVKTKF